MLLVNSEGELPDWIEFDFSLSFTVGWYSSVCSNQS